MVFRVNNQQCQTCIFGPNSPISDQRFEELRQQWEHDNSVQLCHHSHSQVACRGHYEAARNGNIPHPLPDVAAQALGITDIPIADLMQICERLGLIVFVPANDDTTTDNPADPK